MHNIPMEIVWAPNSPWIIVPANRDVTAGTESRSSSARQARRKGYKGSHTSFCSPAFFSQVQVRLRIKWRNQGCSCQPTNSSGIAVLCISESPGCIHPYQTAIELASRSIHRQTDRNGDSGKSGGGGSMILC